VAGGIESLNSPLRDNFLNGHGSAKKAKYNLDINDLNNNPVHLGGPQK
jgi:hypothetical protein